MLIGNQNPEISTSLSYVLKAKLLAGFNIVDSVAIGAIPTGVPGVDPQTLNVLNATNFIVDLADAARSRLIAIESSYITEQEATEIANTQAIIMG